MFDHGVSYYTKGRATVSVGFPEEMVRCRWCRFLRYDKGCDRHWCGLTDRMIYNINAAELPEECPVEICDLEMEDK